MAFFVIVLVIIILLVQKLTMDNAFNGLEFEYYPSVLLAAPDDKFEIVTTITNRHYKFIPYIAVEGRLPSAVMLHDHPSKLVNPLTNEAKFSYSAYLMPRSKLQKSFSASIPKRGRYEFTSAFLSAGDFLGLDEEMRNFASTGEIVVYPKENGSVYIDNVMGGFLGDLSVRRFIMEDPVLSAGSREYTGREPMKAISWSHSARLGNLMVKTYDYTTEPSVTVLLNVECDGADLSLNEKHENIEKCYSITHRVCKILEERRIKYDFYTNATTSGVFRDWAYISEGLGRRHFFTILEGMGRASYRYREPFSSVIKRMDRHSSRALIIISPAEKKDVLPYLDNKNPRQTLIITAGDARR